MPIVYRVDHDSGSTKEVGVFPTMDEALAFLRIDRRPVMPEME